MLWLCSRRHELSKPHNVPLWQEIHGIREVSARRGAVKHGRGAALTGFATRFGPARILAPLPEYFASSATRCGSRAHHLSVWSGGWSGRGREREILAPILVRTGVGPPNLHDLSFPDAVQAGRFMPSVETDRWSVRETDRWSARARLMIPAEFWFDRCI